jgi:hypothetical protein
VADLLLEDDLSRFIRAATERSICWGEWDCLMFVASWVRERRGDDPAQPWRGRYRSEFGAARMMLEQGGMVPLMALGLGAIGMQRTNDPKRGDVAVVNGAEGETGAIILGVNSASIGHRGLFVRRAPIVAAWSV